MVWIPVLISSMSLFVAFFTFYLTQLRPIKIKIIIGPEIQIYHADYPQISTGIYVPITFINTSPNMGIVTRIAISLYKGTSPEKRYFIQLREFHKRIDTGWTYENEAQSFAIAGKTSVSKIAWFMWFGENLSKLSLTEGGYKIAVHVWIGNNKTPTNFVRKFYVSKEAESFFQKSIEDQSRTSLRIILDQELERNRILSTYEAKTLLNDNT